MPNKLIRLRESNLKKAKRINGKVCLDVCGGITPYLAGYNNIDIVKGDFVFDLLKGIPFPDCSVDHLVSVATLEHFNYTEFLFVLSEMVRVLKVGGKISISTPDVEKISAFVVKNGFINHFQEVNQNLYALQRDPYDIHKVALSGSFVLSLLESAGFSDSIEDDPDLLIRHSLELSSRISAVKKQILPKTDWLSVYRHADQILALTKQDRVRISSDHREIALFIPENFSVKGQKMVITLFDKKIKKMRLYPGGTYRIELPLIPELKYYDLKFEFSKTFRPLDAKISADERDISAFLFWNELPPLGT